MKIKLATLHLIDSLSVVLSTLSRVILLGVLLVSSAFAQEQYFGAALIPPKPTSTDYIVYIKAIGGTGSCFRPPFKTIKMVNNNIIIEFAAYPQTIDTPRIAGLLDDTEMVEIGQLPPGEYTITPVNAECPREAKPPLGTTPFTFTVTDSRLATRPMNGGGVDLSGHWWEADNPGSGLFIWQDNAKNTLATWFTYTPDGKPIWYVFQPKSLGRIIGDTTPLLQTSKPPSNIIPLPGNTQFTTVGEAGYQSYFTPILSGPNAGQPELIIKLFYRFGDGKWQTRVLRRFSAQ
jgi:hypothetical protein